MKDILKQIENCKGNIVGVNTRTTREKIAIINLAIQIENIEELNKLTNAVSRVESVYEVKRKRG